MAKQETAFNGELSYRDLASLGKDLARTKNRKEISEHVQTLKSDDIIAVQRSAAILSNASDVDVEIFEDYISCFIEILESNAHHSAPRIIFRILERIARIPEELLGLLVDISFRYLNDSSSSIAEKVFAMTVIANQLDRFPDLKPELEASLSAQIQTGSAGFKNRAGKLAKKYGMEL